MSQIYVFNNIPLISSNAVKDASNPSTFLHLGFILYPWRQLDPPISSIFSCNHLTPHLLIRFQIKPNNEQTFFHQLRNPRLSSRYRLRQHMDKFRFVKNRKHLTLQWIAAIPDGVYTVIDKIGSFIRNKRIITILQGPLW